MTSLPPDRPMPDPADLRLLTQMCRLGSIGLPQLAYFAGMSQGEAAERLATMNQAGMPLRLLVESDQQALWQIVQRGPHPDSLADHGRGLPSSGPTPGLGARPPSGPVPAFGYQPEPDNDPYAADPGPIGRPISPPTPAASADTTTTVAAGSIGQHRRDMENTVPAGPEPMASVWGVPGSSSWATRQASDSPASSFSPRPGTPAATVPPPTPQATRSAEVSESVQAAHEATMLVPVSALGRQPRVGMSQRAVGLSGERITIAVDEVIDPGNDILVAAGYALDDGERAVLVRTTLSIIGPVGYDTMPDLYLFLVDDAGKTLPKAPVAVAGHPAHKVGVRTGDSATGWTIFLIPASTSLTAVRWCVRPDLVERTVNWVI